MLHTSGSTRHNILNDVGTNMIKRQYNIVGILTSRFLSFSFSAVIARAYDVFYSAKAIFNHREFNAW
jgi:hypothetical protein